MTLAQRIHAAVLRHTGHEPVSGDKSSTALLAAIEGAIAESVPTDLREMVARLRELSAKATPRPWTLEVEEYEVNYGQITIPEINRILHDTEWAGPEDWESDLANGGLITESRTALPALLDALATLLSAECATGPSAPGGPDLCPVCRERETMIENAPQALREARRQVYEAIERWAAGKPNTRPEDVSISGNTFDVAPDAVGLEPEAEKLP